MHCYIPYGKVLDPGRPSSEMDLALPSPGRTITQSQRGMALYSDPRINVHVYVFFDISY